MKNEDINTSQAISLDLALASYNESTYVLEQIQNRTLVILVVNALLTIGLALIRPDVPELLRALILIAMGASGILSSIFAASSLLHGTSMLPGPETASQYRQLSYARESDSYSNAMRSITDAIRHNVELIDARWRNANFATILTMAYGGAVIVFYIASISS